MVRPHGQRAEQAGTASTFTKLGSLLKGQLHARKRAVEFIVRNLRLAARRIVEIRASAAESLQHDKVIEVPEEDRWQRHLLQIFDLFLESFGVQTMSPGGLQNVQRFSSISRDAAIDAQLLERNIPAVMRQNHRQ